MSSNTRAGIGVGVESRKIPSYWQYGVVDNVRALPCSTSITAYHCLPLNITILNAVEQWLLSMHTAYNRPEVGQSHRVLGSQ